MTAESKSLVERLGRLRHECARSGLHEHDGCSCSRDELPERENVALELAETAASARATALESRLATLLAPSDRHRWKPSIHLPRKFSRITLKVTGVKVERLQDISEEDANAEGCEPLLVHKSGHTVEPGFEYRIAFALLWNSIHGKGAWEWNPWVVAVSFEVIKANVDSIPTPKSDVRRGLNPQDRKEGN